MGKSRQLTDQERDERRQKDRERLENAARELLTSDGWARWVKVRSSVGLGRYSLRNQWLISADCAKRGITPTHVAGFRAWLALNRVVVKGSKAIYILAPVSVKERDAGGEETGEKRTLFRAVPVFDVEMTEVLPGMEPVPLSPPREPITGNSHAHLLTPLENLAAELGYSVRQLPLDGGVDGWCDYERSEIVVNEQLPANAQVRVLVPWRRWCIRTFGMPWPVVVWGQSLALSAFPRPGRLRWVSDRRRGASCVARGGAAMVAAGSP